MFYFLFQFWQGCFKILTQIHLSKSDVMSRYLSQTGGLTQREIPKSPNWILAVFATIVNKGNVHFSFVSLSKWLQCSLFLRLTTDVFWIMTNSSAATCAPLLSLWATCCRRASVLSREPVHASLCTLEVTCVYLCHPRHFGIALTPTQ